MKIAVKYCGGCNPYYDRVAAVEEIAREFPEAEFSGADAWAAAEDLEGKAAGPDGSDLPDLVLVVCGCQAVCAEHQRLAGREGKMILGSAGDFGKVREKLLDLRRKNNRENGGK